MEFKALQCRKRLVDCRQQLRDVFRLSIRHLEGDPTHAIGIFKSRDQANLCFGEPGSRSIIHVYRQGREMSYRGRSSRPVLRDEQPYVQT